LPPLKDKCAPYKNCTKVFFTAGTTFGGVTEIHGKVPLWLEKALTGGYFGSYNQGKEPGGIVSRTARPPLFHGTADESAYRLHQRFYERHIDLNR